MAHMEESVYLSVLSGYKYALTIVSFSLVSLVYHPEKEK